MKRSGFTLIEMLVVVVVIGILSGLVFRLVGAGGTSSDRAKARRQVEAIANACEEYRAEYGRYPPVAKNLKGEQPFDYIYPDHPDRWTAKNAGSLATLLRNVPRTKLEQNGAHVFRFGLLSYLVPRVEGHAEFAPKELFENPSHLPSDQHSWLSQNAAKNSNISSSTLKEWIKNGKISRGANWNASTCCNAVDNPRDLRAAKKIAPLLEGITRVDINPQSYNGNSYTNLHVHISDPWGNSLRYESDPPHDSFRVWSIGPDGANGTADDIVPGKEN